MQSIGGLIGAPAVLSLTAERRIDRKTPGHKVAGYASGGISPVSSPSYYALRLMVRLIGLEIARPAKRFALVAGHAIFRSLGLLASIGLVATPHVNGNAEKQNPPRLLWAGCFGDFMFHLDTASPKNGI